MSDNENGKGVREMTDEQLEVMCAAHWDLTASIVWEKIPCDWKPGYRDKMRAAMRALEGTYAGSQTELARDEDVIKLPASRTLGRATMNDTKKPGLLVEDETLVGGTDAVTGAPVIKPKTSDGRADESVRPTDAREASK